MITFTPNVAPQGHWTLSGCGPTGSVAATLLADQRDTLTQIRIDGIRLQRCTFSLAVTAVPLYPASRLVGTIRSSQGGCCRKSSVYLSVAQNPTLSKKGYTPLILVV